jgi:hypothetical protein
MADATQTSTETFFVDLSNATGPDGLIRIQRGTARGTIRWLN